MRRRRSRSRVLSWIRILLPALAAGSAALVAAAQDYRDDGAGIDQTVARISYVEGDASYARGDAPDQWQTPDRNAPMTVGDRVYTGGGSLELQLEGGGLVDLGSRTDLTALNMTDQISQFAVQNGIATFSVPRLGPDEIFEVDTPNAAITFVQPGRYRVDVDESGQTRVLVRHGGASVAAGGGQLDLGAGESILIEGSDSPRYQVVAMPPPDRFDSWADSRLERMQRAPSYHYVSASIVGADDLDAYGRWEVLPQYGRVWTPASVESGWAPYREGHWVWQDPWGWTWVSIEPWGWAPYHYGRWVVADARWYWVPVAPAVAAVRYSPALVAFVGGGPSFGISVTVGGGPDVVGWFPLAPREPFHPWWGPHNETTVAVTNVTYVNRTYVTVVNQNTFVSGGLVSPAVIRETSVVRQVAAAPVVAGRMPVIPTTASLRVSARPNAAPAPHPPAAVASRAVVTRVAPPPAPQRFEQKVAVIRENRGAPIAAPTPAPRVAAVNRTTVPAVIPVRSVAAEAGNVKLAPRSGSEQQKRVEPVAPGSAMARRPAAATALQPESRPPAAAQEAPALRPTAAAPRPQDSLEERTRETRPERQVPEEAVPPPRSPAPRNEPPGVEHHLAPPTPRGEPRNGEPKAAPENPRSVPPGAERRLAVPTPHGEPRNTEPENGSSNHRRSVPPGAERRVGPPTPRHENVEPREPAMAPSPEAQHERGRPAPYATPRPPAPSEQDRRSSPENSNSHGRPRPTPRPTPRPPAPE